MAHNKKLHIRIDEAEAIEQGKYENIFGILGLHEVAPQTWEVRNFLPFAEKLEILDYQTQALLAESSRIGVTGVFCARFTAEKPQAYLLKAWYNGEAVLIIG